MTYQNNFDAVLINDVLPIALIEAEEIVLNFLRQESTTKIVKEEAKTIAIKKKKKEKEKEKKGKAKNKKSKKKTKKDSTKINW